MKRRHEVQDNSSWWKLPRLFRWLAPGIGVKRWFLVILTGITFMGTGLAILLLHVYRTAPVTWWLPIISFVSLRFLARPWRILLFAGIGFGLTGLGLWRLNRTLLVPFLRPGQRLLDQMTDYRRRERGPRIVVIGGGHGIATVLRGLKAFTNNLTAVVSVADDGGSSGELRRNLGILPPGDIRNCLAALSDDEALLTQLFQYRFGEDTGLEGHSFGNLFISALSDITGSIEEAIAESGRALSVHGEVLPATLHNVRLVADVQLLNAQTEVRVEGESHIPQAAGRVRRVWLEPDNVSAFPPVIKAILAADMIVIGPGSLYTSILPNLLVSDLLESIRSSRALKVFIANNTLYLNYKGLPPGATREKVLAEYGIKSQDPDILTSAVRSALGRLIIHEISGIQNELPVITLDYDLEQLLHKSLQTAGENGAGIEPGLAEQMHLSLQESTQKMEMEGQTAVLLVSSYVRPWLARFTRHSISGLHVLAYNEIPADRQIKVVSTVGRRP